MDPKIVELQLSLVTDPYVQKYHLEYLMVILSRSNCNVENIYGL